MGAPAGHGELNQDKPILVVDEASGFGILLGDVFHAVDVALMEQLGVTRMICAAKRCRLPSVEHSRQVLTVPLPENGDCELGVMGDFSTDGYEPSSTSASRVEQCFEFLSKAKAEGAKVLVHCSNGKNRSATVVLAWLIQQGWTLSKSVQHLLSKCPSAKVCDGYFSQLQQLEVAKFGGETSVKTNPFTDTK